MNRSSEAAERVDFHIEDMTIPISIKELDFWKKNFSSNKSDFLEDSKGYSELSFWLNMLGFKSREALSDFLETPLVKDRSLARQLLRSWVGRRLLDEISDLVIVGKDKTGSQILITLENLLDYQEEVSLLDLLRSLPVEVIEFDANGWLKVFTNWKNELKKQQKLLVDLRKLPFKSNKASKEKEDKRIFGKSFKELIKIKTPHRLEDLTVELWRPYSKPERRKNWIILMPGLGGDPNHFSWLSSRLSQKGWDVVVIDHPGSNSKAMSALVEGQNSFPEVEELFLYRLADLKTLLDFKEEGSLNIEGDSFILIGHSLGALTAFLAAGAIPQDGLIQRCNQVFNDLSLTNLSRLLQCQITEVLPIKIEKDLDSLSAIIGVNSFGKLLWPDSLNSNINVPFLLTGGTFDLVTPALTEQLGLLLSTENNKFSRALIIEGASHFSPIRVDISSKGSDLYKISDDLVGVEPLYVQEVLTKEIIRFLDNLEDDITLPIAISKHSKNLKYHILDRKVISKITQN